MKNNSHSLITKTNNYPVASLRVLTKDVFIKNLFSLNFLILILLNIIVLVLNYGFYGHPLNKDLSPGKTYQKKQRTSLNTATSGVLFYQKTRKMGMRAKITGATAGLKQKGYDAEILMLKEIFRYHFNKDLNLPPMHRPLNLGDKNYSLNMKLF
jgi:hypothetical protein